MSGDKLGVWLAPLDYACHLPAQLAVIADAQNALNKMRRANHRGTGCRLTAAEIASLNLTRVGELWGQPDPRTEGVK